ncbi:hypothetical protein QNN03_20155 [Streptomyces sp. GXMU-J15]|uniref:Uncharacterized protein n=1 Tax=Streptomyces fuscus TaxID=3048495 RepID=A0ABT7J4Q4_9ACTN|nr:MULTISPECIES: hypothetical protein [Streptomyces]MDL2078752.1 hypothetical protein [Streptomyces fuscus]SBT95781.1 hypothetical protein GA0115233_11688 [Streptomyces sp. DI166]
MSAAGTAPEAVYGTVEHFLGLLLPGGLPPESACPGRLVSARTVTHQGGPAPRAAGRGERRTRSGRGRTT